MKKLMIGAAVATLVSGSAFAQSYYRHGHQASAAYGAVTPFATERAAAIHDCNAAAAKTYPIRDSNWSVSLYRACMTEHGQPE